MAVLELKMFSEYPNRVEATKERVSDLKAEPYKLPNLKSRKKKNGRGKENWASGIHRS